jgi:hypothetical protein
MNKTMGVISGLGRGAGLMSLFDPIEAIDGARG